jgi:hypothetical protein
MIPFTFLHNYPLKNFRENQLLYNYVTNIFYILANDDDILFLILFIDTCEAFHQSAPVVTVKSVF